MAQFRRDEPDNPALLSGTKPMFDPAPLKVPAARLAPV